MNTEFPCKTCPKKLDCWGWCDDILSFYGRFIKGYANAGTNSYMYKAVRKIVPYSTVKKICSALDRCFNVGITHPNSGDWVSLNRKGVVVSRGTKNDDKYDIWRN